MDDIEFFFDRTQAILNERPFSSEIKEDIETVIENTQEEFLSGALNISKEDLPAYIKQYMRNITEKLIRLLNLNETDFNVDKKDFCDIFFELEQCLLTNNLDLDENLVNPDGADDPDDDLNAFSEPIENNLVSQRQTRSMTTGQDNSSTETKPELDTPVEADETAFPILAPVESTAAATEKEETTSYGNTPQLSSTLNATDTEEITSFGNASQSSSTLSGISPQASSTSPLPVSISAEVNIITEDTVITSPIPSTGLVTAEVIPPQQLTTGASFPILHNGIPSNPTNEELPTTTDFMTTSVVNHPSSTTTSLDFISTSTLNGSRPTTTTSFPESDFASTSSNDLTSSITVISTIDTFTQDVSDSSSTSLELKTISELKPRPSTESMNSFPILAGPLTVATTNENIITEDVVTSTRPDLPISFTTRLSQTSSASDIVTSSIRSKASTSGLQMASGVLTTSANTPQIPISSTAFVSESDTLTDIETTTLPSSNLENFSNTTSKLPITTQVNLTFGPLNTIIAGLTKQSSPGQSSEQVTQTEPKVNSTESLPVLTLTTTISTAVDKTSNDQTTQTVFNSTAALNTTIAVQTEHASIGQTFEPPINSTESLPLTIFNSTVAVPTEHVPIGQTSEPPNNSTEDLPLTILNTTIIIPTNQTSVGDISDQHNISEPLANSTETLPVIPLKTTTPGLVKSTMGRSDSTINSTDLVAVSSFVSTFTITEKSSTINATTDKSVTTMTHSNLTFPIWPFATTNGIRNTTMQKTTSKMMNKITSALFFTSTPSKTVQMKKTTARNIRKTSPDSNQIHFTTSTTSSPKECNKKMTTREVRFPPTHPSFPYEGEDSLSRQYVRVLLGCVEKAFNTLISLIKFLTRHAA